MMNHKSKTCFMESMWRDLPADVLEKVFAFLPLASLCQFRTLSKEWNRTISSPTFKHAWASEEEYALITPRLVRSTGGWVVLDVARDRYFTLSDAFLIRHVQRQKLLPRTAVVKSVLAATDGGLFCAWCTFSVETSGMYVCNPVLKTVKQLPHPPGVEWGVCNETVVMATDKNSMEYEIFVVNKAGGMTFKPESIFVYESKTSRWRTAFYGPSSYVIWWHSLTIFNNNLYCITETTSLSRDGLVSYDKETGVVSELRGIDFPYSIGRSHLVVSNARLFCVIPVEDLGYGFPSVEIFELDVVKRVSTQLTEMPPALLFWVLGHDLERKFWPMARTIEVVTGSADCILIATFIGRCAAYSLSRKSWYQFTDDRSLLEEDCRTNRKHAMLFGSNNCLSLCAP